jgi:hypothetical protein
VESTRVYCIDHSLVAAISGMISNSSYYDVNFKFPDSDAELQAHKAILSARSPVFHAMFEAQMRESETGIIFVADIALDVMTELLKFIYTGSFTSHPSHDPSNARIEDIYVASCKYEISEARAVCRAELIKKLSDDNIAAMLVLADDFGDEELKFKAVRCAQCECHNTFHLFKYSGRDYDFLLPPSDAGAAEEPASKRSKTGRQGK